MFFYSYIAEFSPHYIAEAGCSITLGILVLFFCFDCLLVVFCSSSSSINSSDVITSPSILTFKMFCSLTLGRLILLNFQNTSRIILQTYFCIFIYFEYMVIPNFIIFPMHLHHSRVYKQYHIIKSMVL